MLEVLDALGVAGLRVWLDGGWGVDALLGRQSRPHDDVDVVVELSAVAEVWAALVPLGFEMTDDLRPTRAVLRTADGRQVDLHPITFDAGGTGWQVGASPDGSDCAYPGGGFASGRIMGRSVPCLAASLQVAHHLGYEPTDRDRADMASLTRRYGLVLPHPY